MGKSFANGNEDPNSPGLGNRPPQAAAMSASSWELVLGTSPHQFAS